MSTQGLARDDLPGCAGSWLCRVPLCLWLCISSLLIQPCSTAAACEIRCKTKHPMANKEQNINRAEKEGRGERMGEWFMKTHHHFPVNRSFSLCDQAAQEAGGKEKEKKIFFTHFFTWLHTSQKPSLCADMWMLIPLTETFINIPHDPPRGWLDL